MATFRGLAFPFGRGSELPAVATDDELVKQSILQIMLTGQGERVMRPDFGASAYAHVFENNNLLLEQAIKFNIQSSIAKYEPRAIVQAVDVTRDEDKGTVTVIVSFVVTSTRNSLSVEAELTGQ